jgi:hypothetical protein
VDQDFDEGDHGEDLMKTRRREMERRQSKDGEATLRAPQ